MRLRRSYRVVLTGPGICFALVSFGSCAAGRHHTSDAVLEEQFFKHETDFEALLAQVQLDARLMTIQPKAVIYANRLVNVADGNFSELERLGMTRFTWRQYQEQLRKLGIAGIMKGAGRVEFRVDAGSISNADSYKGYEFRLTPPETVAPTLDNYRVSESDRSRSGGWSVYKRLKGNWFIYLFVNG